MAFTDLETIEEMFDELAWSRHKLDMAMALAYEELLRRNAKWLEQAMKDPVYRARRAEQVRAANRWAHAKKRQDPERWAKRLEQMRAAEKRYRERRRQRHGNREVQQVS